jgi:hypothetical protein
MKKAYERPVFVLRGTLSKVTAQEIPSNFVPPPP